MQKITENYFWLQLKRSKTAKVSNCSICGYFYRLEIHLKSVLTGMNNFKIVLYIVTINTLSVGYANICFV